MNEVGGPSKPHPVPEFAGGGPAGAGVGGGGGTAVVTGAGVGVGMTGGPTTGGHPPPPGPGWLTHGVGEDGGVAVGTLGVGLVGEGEGVGCPPEGVAVITGLLATGAGVGIPQLLPPGPGWLTEGVDVGAGVKVVVDVTGHGRAVPALPLNVQA